jgi:hypothetical protein
MLHWQRQVIRLSINARSIHFLVADSRASVRIDMLTFQQILIGNIRVAINSAHDAHVCAVVSTFDVASDRREIQQLTNDFEK